MRHRREFTLAKTHNTLHIRDRFTCRSAHDIRRYFHLAPDCSVQLHSDTSVRISCESGSVTLDANSGSLEIVSATDERPFAWISSGYHLREPSVCIVVTEQIVGETTLETRIAAPYS